jgi:hypothetical protein
MTTGTNQSEEIVKYAKLNVARMNRLDKTVSVLPELRSAMEQLKGTYEWLVITEGWCGDASQSVPVIAAIASCSSQVEFKMILRDEYPEVMDQYLTSGTRSIPVLVVRDKATGKDLFKWGPRPAELSTLVSEWKKTMDHEAFVEKIHAWYAHDKTQTLQHEILSLVQAMQ